MFAVCGVNGELMYVVKLLREVFEPVRSMSHCVCGVCVCGVCGVWRPDFIGGAGFLLFDGADLGRNRFGELE